MDEFRQTRATGNPERDVYRAMLARYAICADCNHDVCVDFWSTCLDQTSYDLAKDGWTKWEWRSCLLLPHEKEVQCFCSPAVKWLQKQVWSCVARWLIHRLWLGLTMIDVFLGGGIAGQAQSLKYKDHITEPRPIWSFCGFPLCFSEQTPILWSPLQQCRS